MLICIFEREVPSLSSDFQRIPDFKKVKHYKKTLFTELCPPITGPFIWVS
jgi:hypothetical protein